jgi:hypothetical protein
MNWKKWLGLTAVIFAFMSWKPEPARADSYQLAIRRLWLQFPLLRSHLQPGQQLRAT